mgnify:CR=1 FL=1
MAAHGQAHVLGQPGKRRFVLKGEDPDALRKRQPLDDGAQKFGIDALYRPLIAVTSSLRKAWGEPVFTSAGARAAPVG